MLKIEVVEWNIQEGRRENMCEINNGGLFEHLERGNKYAERLEVQDQLYQQDQRRQEQTRMQKDYQLRRYDPAQTQRTKHEKSSGLKAVRDAVARFFRFRKQNMFSEYDTIAQSEKEEDRRLNLHHALGTKLSSEGHEVLEIDVAGSGFLHFRRDASGFKGRKKTSDNPHFQQVIGTKINATKKGGIFRKEKKVGEGQRKKTVTRYNISGPLSLGGAHDGGDYSIDNIQNYILNYGKEYLTNIFTNSDWQNNPENVYLNIQGHSRGGVAVSLGVKRLMEWIQTQYPDYLPYAKFNLIQHDPVPGADVISGEKVKVDLRSEIEQAINATTFLSIQTEHYVLQFTPQEVRGQNRIILSTGMHSVGLSQGDDSQLDASGQQKVHRAALFDAKTKQAYRGSGVSEMPKGVFLQDENGALLRMRSLSHAFHIVKDMRENVYSQHSRNTVTMRMIKNWFIDNEYVDETETETEYFEEKAHTDDTITKLLGSTWGFRDSSLMKNVKQSIREMQQARSNKELPADARIAVYDSVIKACKDYMEGRDPSTDSGRERLAMVGDILSQMRAEKKRFSEVQLRNVKRRFENN